MERENESESERKIGPWDFEILRMVGRGAFGKVFQVRKKKKKNSEDDGGDGIYAMKVMRKDTIIKKNHVDYMKAERDILTKVVHPFIVPLQYSFQVKNPYFVLALLIYIYIYNYINVCTFVNIYFLIYRCALLYWLPFDFYSLLINFDLILNYHCFLCMELYDKAKK